MLGEELCVCVCVLLLTAFLFSLSLSLMHGWLVVSLYRSQTSTSLELLAIHLLRSSYNLGRLKKCTHYYFDVDHIKQAVGREVGRV